MADKKIQGAGSVGARRQLIDNDPRLTRKRKCELLCVGRSGTYYTPKEKEEAAGLRQALTELYRLDPCLGVRKLEVVLKRDYGICAGEKMIARVRREMGLRTIFRHPMTSRPSRRQEGKTPYLLKKEPPRRVDDVWTSDITYLQIGRCNIYLCCVMDWVSREILGWSLGLRMETGLCMEALEMALEGGRKPKVFNTDQGSQYTSTQWSAALSSYGITISMDGKGRWADNIIMERFWRTYKHDFFLLRECRSLQEAHQVTAEWLNYYNTQRPHESLNYETPSGYSRRQGYPPAANFSGVSYASSKLTPLRSVPSLRSGRLAYASETPEKWIDISPCCML